MHLGWDHLKYRVDSFLTTVLVFQATTVSATYLLAFPSEMRCAVICKCEEPLLNPKFVYVCTLKSDTYVCENMIHISPQQQLVARQ
jgi:hypothetical protein